MDDVKFNEALASKRHKEILEVFKLISNKLSANHPSEAIIEKLRKALSSISISLKNNKDLQILEEIEKIYNILNNQKSNSSKECTLIINRNIQGFIETIDVKYKCDN